MPWESSRDHPLNLRISCRRPWETSAHHPTFIPFPDSTDSPIRTPGTTWPPSWQPQVGHFRPCPIRAPWTMASKAWARSPRKGESGGKQWHFWAMSRPSIPQGVISWDWAHLKVQLWERTLELCSRRGPLRPAQKGTSTWRAVCKHWSSNLFPLPWKKSLLVSSQRSERNMEWEDTQRVTPFILFGVGSFFHLEEMVWDQINQRTTCTNRRSTRGREVEGEDTIPLLAKMADTLLWYILLIWYENCSWNMRNLLEFTSFLVPFCLARSTYIYVNLRAEVFAWITPDYPRQTGCWPISWFSSKSWFGCFLVREREGGLTYRDST